MNNSKQNFKETQESLGYDVGDIVAFKAYGRVIDLYLVLNIFERDYHDSWTGQEFTEWCADFYDIHNNRVMRNTRFPHTYDKMTVEKDENLF
jgi:hypothetical protein